MFDNSEKIKKSFISVLSKYVKSPTTRIQNSYIEASCELEEDVEIIDSILLEGATVKSGCRITNRYLILHLNSVIGCGVMIGSGNTIDKANITGNIMPKAK